MLRQTTKSWYHLVIYWFEGIQFKNITVYANNTMKYK